MKYINTMREGERVIEHYLCKHKESRDSRNGKTFFSLRLQDKTGTVDAKVWEITNDIGSFAENDIVKIDATVGSFNGELQLKITKLRKSQEGEYDIADFIPTSSRDIGEMYAQITALVKTVKNPFLLQLLENIFVKDKERAEMFKSHSAAMYMHHAFMGGLLEHTLNVAELCVFIGTRYKYIDTDLLLAGALLHDIGKIQEIAPLPKSEYTDDGQLLGHIIMGVELINEETAKIPKFPHELASLLKHCIVSHHGEMEFGSPKLPSIPEAMIIHFADNIDAKITTFGDVYDKDTSTGLWTAFQKALGRYVRKPQ